MARKHPQAYPLDFRQKVVELAQAGRGPDDLAHEFGLARQTVRNWIKQSELDSGRRSDGLTSEERAELFKLRKQVSSLRSSARSCQKPGCVISSSRAAWRHR